jgi:methylthioribulose-1-phosphate dehydratase
MVFWNSLDYLFQLAVQMKQLGISWLSDIPETLPGAKVDASK